MILLVLVTISMFGFISPWSIQGATIPFYINPGATNSESQNPISPLANFTVIAGNNVTWINKDSSPHMIVSGTPENGSDNIFYGDFFGPTENYTVLFDKPGVYPYYDPAWSHIRGVITVERPEFTSDQGSTINGSSAGSIDDSFVVGSNTTDGFSSNSTDINSSESGLTSFPSSLSSSFSPSSISTFPSFTSDNISDQSSPLSKLTSHQVLKSIANKVGPLLGLLMGGGSDSSSSSISPQSTFSPSNNAHENEFRNSGNFTNYNISSQILSNDYSSLPLNNSIVTQNISSSALEVDRTKIQQELVGVLKKAFINKVDIPVLPSSFVDDGDSYVYVKMNIIDSGDKNVNASNFVIPYQTGGSIIGEFGESGSETINDGGLFIRLHAGNYNITSEPQEVHYFVNSQDVGNPALMTLLKSYSTSYSEGCSGHINNMEVKDCIITKKYP